MAERGHVHGLRIGRIYKDVANVVGVTEPEVRPALATISRLVDAVAPRNAVARVVLTRAHPDDVGVGRMDGDGADGIGAFVIEERLEGDSIVHGPPEAARRSGDEDRVRELTDHVDVDDATAGSRRADRAPAEVFEEGFVELGGLGGAGRAG